MLPQNYGQKFDMTQPTKQVEETKQKDIIYTALYSCLVSISTQQSMEEALTLTHTNTKTHTGGKE